MRRAEQAIEAIHDAFHAEGELFEFHAKGQTQGSGEPAPILLLRMNTAIVASRTIDRPELIAAHEEAQPMGILSGAAIVGLRKRIELYHCLFDAQFNVVSPIGRAVWGRPYQGTTIGEVMETLVGTGMTIPPLVIERWKNVPLLGKKASQ